MDTFAEDPTILHFDDALTRVTQEAEVIAHLTGIAKKTLNPHIIVSLVELRLINNSVESKLPVIYVMDSIMKNIGEPFIELFGHHIYQVFTSTLNEVDESVVAPMERVFKSWKNPPLKIFSDELLEKIEARMNQIKNLREMYLADIPIPNDWPTEKIDGSTENYGNILEISLIKDIYAHVHEKQVLPEQDAKFSNKLKFLQESLITQLTLKNQISKLLGLSVHPDVPHLLKLYEQFQKMKKIPQYSNLVYPLSTNSNIASIANLAKLSGILNYVENSNVAKPASQANAGINISVGNSVESSKFNGGTIEENDSATDVASEKKIRPSLLDLQSLLVYNRQAIENLYENRPFQCSQCGMRYITQIELDTHAVEFHIRLKVGLEKNSRIMSCRQWYLSADDWLEVLGGVMVRNDEASFKIVQKENDAKQPVERVISRVVADDFDGIRKCDGCGEDLVNEWDNKAENWFYRECKKDSKGHIYHIKCFPNEEINNNNNNNNNSFKDIDISMNQQYDGDILYKKRLQNDNYFESIEQDELASKKSKIESLKN